MSLDTHNEETAHHEHPDVVGSRNRLGVILILVADIAFALSILFVFFYLKGQNVNNMWLPAAHDEVKAILPISSKGSWTVTAIVAIGLLSHYFALRGVRAGHQSQLNIGGVVALLAAVVATILQINQIANAPFGFDAGAYASCYFLITILNVVHLLLTVFIAFGNWNRTRLGLYKKDHWHVDIVNVWWVWMTVSSLLGAFALSFPN
jgi:heme/copper-type cytochrome/quinol oxidase subunit 3